MHIFRVLPFLSLLSGKSRSRASSDDDDFIVPDDSEEEVRSTKSSSSRRSSMSSRRSGGTEDEDEDEADFDADDLDLDNDVPKKSKPKGKPKASGGSKSSKANTTMTSTGPGVVNFLTAAEQREQGKKDEKKSAESPYSFLQDVRDVSPPCLAHKFSVANLFIIRRKTRGSLLIQITILERYISRTRLGLLSPLSRSRCAFFCYLPWIILSLTHCIVLGGWSY